MIAIATNRIREWRHRRGVSLERLAQLVGVSPSYLNRMETGDRNVSVSRLSPISRALDVPVSELVNDNGTLLVGWIGTGGRVEFFDDSRGQGDGRTVAIEVRDNALGAMFDGWHVLFDNVRSAPSEDAIDCVCVVGLADGRVLVRQLKPGQIEGRYNLLSGIESPIYDAAVQWAARVRRLVPQC